MRPIKGIELGCEHHVKESKNNSQFFSDQDCIENYKFFIQENSTKFLGCLWLQLLCSHKHLPVGFFLFKQEKFPEIMTIVYC